MKATYIFNHINVLTIAQIYKFTHPQKTATIISSNYDWYW